LLERRTEQPRIKFKKGKKKKKDIINKNEGKELITQEIRIRKKGLSR
jgi:hypothetical protein